MLENASLLILYVCGRDRHVGDTITLGNRWMLSFSSILNESGKGSIEA